MYNYVKNSVSINKDVMAKVEDFEKIARTLATESVEHNAQKHEYEDALKKAIDEEKIDDVKAIEKTIENLEATWKARQTELNRALFGGKDGDKKVDGICDIVSKDLYKAYVDYVTNGTTQKYREELKKFVISIINGDSIKDGAYNHLFNDIVTTMSSKRYNSNSQIAKGASFITTVNKRTYKKMLLGAICDIVSNNKTLKVK